MDITPQPVDAHLLQGEEYVNIANCVQDSSSGTCPLKSSNEFLPCSTDLQELPKMDMTPQPHLLQGEEYVNIANLVQDSSSGISHRVMKMSGSSQRSCQDLATSKTKLSN